MSLSDRVRGFAAWLTGPQGLMALAVSLLFVLMSVSFVNIPWNLPSQECRDATGSLCEIPVTHGSAESPSIADALFGPYVLLVILSGLVLAACMIGGVYLAKVEGGRLP